MAQTTTEITRRCSPTYCPLRSYCGSRSKMPGCGRTGRISTFREKPCRPMATNASSPTTSDCFGARTGKRRGYSPSSPTRPNNCMPRPAPRRPRLAWRGSPTAFPVSCSSSSIWARVKGTSSMSAPAIKKWICAPVRNCSPISTTTCFPIWTSNCAPCCSPSWSARLMKRTGSISASRPVS
ncbi:hypothetical protein D3C85_1194090 [compost metagenome]